MKIRFTDDRRLLAGTVVRQGDERDFPDDEAAAFVASGVAIMIPTAQKAPKEVTDNG